MCFESDTVMSLFRILTNTISGSISHRFKTKDNKMIRIIYIGFSVDYELLHDCELAKKLLKCFNSIKFKEEKDGLMNECIVIFDREYIDLINLVFECAKTLNINALSSLFKRLGIVHYLSDEYLIVGLRSENMSKEHIDKLAKKFKTYKLKMFNKKVIMINDKYKENLKSILN